MYEYQCKNTQENSCKPYPRTLQIDHSLQLNRASMDAGMVQYIEIHKSNPVYKQTQRKNHMIISLDPEKAFDKIQHSFMLKVLESKK